MPYNLKSAFSIIEENLWKPIRAPTFPYRKSYYRSKTETIGETSVNVNTFGNSIKSKLIVIKDNDVLLFELDWILKFNHTLPPGAKVSTDDQRHS